MADPVSLALHPCAMNRAQFLALFGSLYEHSPWVAEQVFERGLERRHDDPEQLHQVFRQAVLAAAPRRQLALLRAHPQLAARCAPLTDASRGEQAGAGLGQCSAEEFRAFEELNARYLERFGFPFIIAVKGLDRATILAAFRQRIEHSEAQEFQAALEQVCLIGRHRLQALFDA